MTNAERQAAFRTRKLDSGEGSRLNNMVHPTVTAGLQRLSAHHGETQADILKRLVQDAESKAIKGMSAKDEKAYYAVTDQS